MSLCVSGSCSLLCLSLSLSYHICSVLLSACECSVCLSLSRCNELFSLSVSIVKDLILQVLSLFFHSLSVCLSLGNELVSCILSLDEYVSELESRVVSAAACILFSLLELFLKLLDLVLLSFYLGILLADLLLVVSDPNLHSIGRSHKLCNLVLSFLYLLFEFLLALEILLLSAAC